MKLVTEFLTAGEADLAASTLEKAGIATYVSNSDSARLPVASSYAGGVGVWVVVDEQLRDAQQLLENPDHEVQVELTDEQRREIHKLASDTSMQGGLGLLFQLLAATILLVFLVFIVTRF